MNFLEAISDLNTNPNHRAINLDWGNRDKYVYVGHSSKQLLYEDGKNASPYGMIPEAKDILSHNWLIIPEKDRPKTFMQVIRVVKELKKGNYMFRLSWENGKYIKLSLKEDALVEFNQDGCINWTATYDDILAEDWCVAFGSRYSQI